MFALGVTQGNEDTPTVQDFIISYLVYIKRIRRQGGVLL